MASKSVHEPMVLKMERICRGYIDQLEKPDGKRYNIQNFMMMYIFGATNNTKYRDGSCLKFSNILIPGGLISII